MPSSSAKKTMVRLEVKSLDSTRTVADAMEEIEKLSPELQAFIEARFPGVHITVSRVEGIPFGPEIQHLMLQIDWHAVAKGAEGAAGGFVAKEALQFLKEKVRNLFFSEHRPKAESSRDDKEEKASVRAKRTQTPKKAKHAAAKTSSKKPSKRRNR